MTERNNSTSKLILKVFVKTTDEGKKIYKQRTISRLNPALTDDQALELGKIVGGLQTQKVEAISRTDAAALVAAAG